MKTNKNCSYCGKEVKKKNTKYCNKYCFRNSIKKTNTAWKKEINGSYKLFQDSKNEKTF